MHFSEDDLREALKRKDPGEGFTQRTLWLRVNQAPVNQAGSKEQPATKKVNGKFLSWWIHRSGVGRGRGGDIAAGVRNWRLPIL